MKIPKAVQLPSGSWRVRVYINGKTESFTKDTEEEAVNAALLAKLRVSKDDAEKHDALSKVTLRSAIDKYIDDRQGILSPSTLRAYDSIRRNRFQSAMDLPLTTDMDWQRLLKVEAKEVSAKTLKNVWGLIKSVLTENGITVGKVRLPQVITQKRPFLQPEQILTFVSAIEGHKYELPYLLCLHGLRRSEMLAITKEDVYADVIHVHGSVVKGMDGKWVRREENKNVTSRRNVPVMIPRLTELAEKSETDILCPWAAGTVQKPLTTVMKQLGFPDIGVHGLRRSFASLCYHLNVSEAQTMEWGGWSDISTMRKIYIQIAEQDRLLKAQELKNFFKGYEGSR